LNSLAPVCQFVLGFKTIHDQIPGTVGDCLDNQDYAPNGDALQHTSKGLLTWRKQDNWTAFTDGSRSWVEGPNGLQSRLNSERFPWEPGALINAAAAAALGDGAVVVSGQDWIAAFPSGWTSLQRDQVTGTLATGAAVSFMQARRQATSGQQIVGDDDIQLFLRTALDGAMPGAQSSAVYHGTIATFMDATYDGQPLRLMMWIERGKVWASIVRTTSSDPASVAELRKVLGQVMATWTPA
jgi:hypothetical protein